MKGAVLALFCAVALTHGEIVGNGDPSQAPAICAAADSDGVLVAHETCNRFYKCSFGVPVVFRCPSILLYDFNKEQCEWPQTVECGDRIILENDYSEESEWVPGGSGNDDPSQAQAICAAEGSDHVLIAHEICNKFYQCWAGQPVALRCPANLLFDPSKDYCDFAFSVDCGDRTIVDDDGSDTGNNNRGVEEAIPEGNNHDDPSQALCASIASDNLLIAHENCNQFYKCAHGSPVALACPGTLLFDPRVDRCEWPATVDCGNRVIPEPDNNIGGGNEWTGNEGAGNEDPSLAPVICAAEGSDNVLIAHENCDQFYQCWAGRPIPFECPPDLLFNPDKDYCDFSYNVNCGDRVIRVNHLNEAGASNQGGNTNTVDDVPVGNNNNDPSQASAICAADGSNSILVAHENCNQFYMCSFGVPVALTCVATLLFDPTTDRCEWAHSVECGDRVIPEPDDNIGGGDEWTDNVGAGNDDPSQAPTICAAEGSDNVLVAHENCNQYYQCWAGRPIPFECPPNLLFNSEKDYCDFAFNVDCSNRLV